VERNNYRKTLDSTAFSVAHHFLRPPCAQTVPGSAAGRRRNRGRSRQAAPFRLAPTQTRYGAGRRPIRPGARAGLPGRADRPATLSAPPPGPNSDLPPATARPHDARPKPAPAEPDP